MGPRSVWPMLVRPGFLASAWPWRALAYLVGGVFCGSAALLAILISVLIGRTTTPPLGVAVAVATLALLALPLAELELWRLRLLRPGLRVRETPSSSGRFTRRARRAWGFCLLAAPLCIVDALVLVVPVTVALILLAAPWLMVHDGGRLTVLSGWIVVDSPAEAWTAAATGVAVAAGALYLLAGYAGARAALAQVMLAPRHGQMHVALVSAADSRARLAFAFDAERHRIERDLHDGVQQQFLGVTMSLGLARLDVPDTPAGAAVLARIDQARDHATQAMAELRNLIQGIHPRVLTDRGLAAAVEVAAERLDIPVRIDMDLPERPARETESAAYFAVCEACANIAKHSRAGQASITGRLEGDVLVVEIRDDGVGGADSDRGGGLVGLADRLAAVDGVMLLSSPAGGPTIVRLEIPCLPNRCA